MVKYSVNEFFSAERYPLPMECPECGKTMRPVHKHRLPDLPQYYFCTFCDAMIPENHPSIRFRKPITNADRIRAMSDEELAEWLQGLKYSPSCDSKCHNDFEKYGEQHTYCVDCWLEWLKEEVK